MNESPVCKRCGKSGDKATLVTLSASGSREIAGPLCLDCFTKGSKEAVKKMSTLTPKGGGMNEFTKERLYLQRLAVRITARNKNLEELFKARAEAWKVLDDKGVKRSTIAKWSGIDPILVTRALRD